MNKWMIQTERDKQDYHTVTYNGGYHCTCPHFDPRKPGWCKHILAVSGAQVSVKQRKYGHIVRVDK